ncbi:hypothetical protein F5B20DRAFT_591209 [Whalleya microplaca]|nr:hypothetical protein F5B20DRAFT_591209 [Whalleya microplaca]
MADKPIPTILVKPKKLSPIAWARKKTLRTNQPVTAESSSSSKEAGHPTTYQSSGTQTIDTATKSLVDPLITNEQISATTSTAPKEQQKTTLRPHVGPLIEPQGRNEASLFTSSHLGHDFEKHLDSSPPTLVHVKEKRTLWDDAYDLIKRRDRSIVRWYETIISGDLQHPAPEIAPRSRSSEPIENIISQRDYLFRRQQMNRLLGGWFDGSDVDGWTHTDVYEHESDVSLLSYREIFAKSQGKGCPGAVIAWVAACYGSQILQTPTSANENDCSGIIYVISRMEWYDLLSRLSMGDKEDNSPDPALRNRTLDLYAVVLSYLMKVTCFHFNEPDFNFPIEVIYGKPTLEGIIEAEKALSLFNEKLVKNPLEMLLDATRTEQTIYKDTAGEQPVRNGGLIEGLHVVDPRPRYMDTTDPNQMQAMNEVYNWLLKRREYHDFREWSKSDSRILLINGPPGQGMTLLLNGAVQALPKEPDAKCLSFFFFEYGNSESNNAAAALRNLMWHILVQQPSLEIHLKQKYDTTGRKEFNHPNDFIALSAVFYAMIQDQSFPETYLIIDSLDECAYNGAWVGLDALVDLIVMSTSLSTRVRWLVSSNYDEPIKSKFETCGGQYLDLGPNVHGSHVVMQNYIKYKASKLAVDKSYDNELETTVVDRLYKQGPDNYLWVDIVCEALRSEEIWYVEDFMKELEVRRDLPSLYSYLQDELNSAHQQKDRDFCFDVLSTLAVVHQSLHLIHSFMNGHFLIWVDALSTAKRISQATIRLQQADFHLQQMYMKETADDDLNDLCDLIHDAHLFLQLHQSTNSPSDLPASNTLLFCPENSFTKKAWFPRAFPWLSDSPVMDQHWNYNFTNFRGHTGSVTDNAISSDGQILASGSEDGTVRIWDTQTGTTQQTLSVGRNAEVIRVAVSKRTVAASSDENLVVVWDIFTGCELGTLSHVKYTHAHALCLSSAGDKLAVSYDRSVQIWDVDGKQDNWRHSEVKEYPSRVHSLEFSQDGMLLLLGVSDMIEIWDINNHLIREKFESPTAITCAVFSSYSIGEKKLIASGLADGSVCIWKTDSEPGYKGTKPLQVAEIANAQNDPSDSTREGKLEVAKEISAVTTKPTQILRGQPGSPGNTGIRVRSMAFSPDGLRLASASGNTIDIWDITTGTRLRTFQTSGSDTFIVVFASPDGAYLASNSLDNNVHLWNVAGRPEKALPDTTSKRKAINELAICPQKKMIAGARLGGLVVLWDLESKALIPRETQLRHTGNVRLLAFSPNEGEKLLSASDDGTVQVCDVATGSRLHIFKGHKDWVRYAAWSADGYYVASASDDGSVRIWKIGGKEEVAPTQILDGAHEGSYARAVAFSPDGKYLVSGGSDKKVVVWEQIKHGVWERKGIPLDGHTKPVDSVLVTPDSKHVLSASIFDTTLRMWDLGNREETQPPIRIDWVDSKMWWYPPVPHGQGTPNYVMTPQGAQPLGFSLPETSKAQTPNYWRLRYNRKSSGCWITSRDKDVIFFPKEFVPRSSLVLGERAVIGTRSGDIYVFGASNG